MRIGQSGVGIGQIGTAPFDVMQTVGSQYANSPVLLSILQNMAEWLDPGALTDEFFDTVWNIETAHGNGLDIWGRILGAPRVIAGAPSKYVGFAQAGTLSADPFDQSPWYAGEKSSENYTLSDSLYRQLLYAKAAANICDGSIPAINAVMRLMFPGQICYIIDNGNLSMTYTFAFTLSPVQQTMVSNPAFLPSPAGVAVNILQI